MTPEEIISKIYTQCAERCRADLVPSIMKKFTKELRKIADDCDALVKKELAKKGKGKP
jgi:hypothetical protein